MSTQVKVVRDVAVGSAICQQRNALLLARLPGGMRGSAAEGNAPLGPSHPLPSSLSRSFGTQRSSDLGDG
jgi:hypothetical protein